MTYDPIDTSASDDSADSTVTVDDIDTTVLQGLNLDDAPAGREVRITEENGQTVFTAAPPQLPITNGLLAQYDFSQQDGTMPLVDNSTNGRDLTTGDYTLSTLNGIQAGAFPNDNPRFGFGTHSKPLSFFVAGQTADFTDQQRFIDDTGGGGSSYLPFIIRKEDSPGAIPEGNMYTDNNLFWDFTTDGVNPQTDPFIQTTIGGSSTMTARLNGVFKNSGAVGGNTLSDFCVGGNKDGNSRVKGVIGEVLVYDNDQLNNAPQIEQYLSDKWSIPI